MSGLWQVLTRYLLIDWLTELLWKSPLYSFLWLLARLWGHLCLGLSILSCLSGEVAVK